MRTCPVCSRQYEPPAQFCQVDGVALRIDAPSVDPYLGTKILEQFRLDRVIGAGGMGIVYEGWNDALSRRVAVKILHRDLVTNKDIVTRFHREAQIASQLDHPGIVRVILFGQLADGNLYLVLEFLEGPTLAEALERDGTFSTERAVRTVGQIADAIGYSHQKGIIHRDLKPENIVLTTREGVEIPKVLDFGIAKMLVGAASFVTQSGLIFGTARYISPEGAAGEKVDQRSDVYSLGVMAYELMAGRAPFEADEPVQLLVKHMHESPAPLRKWGPSMGVPAAVEDVVMRALAKNPDARHEDAGVFARALREAYASSLASLAPAPPPHSDSRPVRAPDTLAPTEDRSATNRVAAPVVATAAAHPTPVVNGSMRAGGNGAMVPAHAASLPQREEFPAFDPAGFGVPEPTAVRTALPTVAPATMAMPELMTAQVIPIDDEIHVSGLPSRRVTRPTAEDDDFSAPPRRSSPWKALGLVLLAGTMASSVMAGGAWALHLFPEQRRADNVASLLRRASDAMRADRLARSPTHYSVEDITNDVLAIEPDNVRARQLRRGAAVKLANSATTARNNRHPELAIPLIEDALRLMEDPVLRQELAEARQELEDQRAHPVVTPALRPHPVVRPMAPAAPPTAPATAPATVPRGDAGTPAASADTIATRRSASRGRNATPATPPEPEPGVTFTPGRDALGNPTTPVLQTPLGPILLTLPQQSAPDAPPATVPPATDPAPTAPHTGEF